jgi:hypothetical protein
MGSRRLLKAGLRRLRDWLNKDAERRDPVIPFDNSYAWLNPTFIQLNRDPIIAKRPQYAWGMLQGVALAKVLGMDRVSIIEFGVAGGAGILAMERIADKIEEMLAVSIDVFGFDSETGLPKPQDYRDCPHLWLDGQFPMDREQLEKRLRRTSLKLGLVENTVPTFMESSPAPVAFASFDLDLYSSSRGALRLLGARHDLLLPRILCYFDNIIGPTYSDYNGERLAIAEFNTEHAMRKLSPQYGLKHFVPRAHANAWWAELFYFCHIFDHPLYNHPDQLRKPMIIDLEGNIDGYTATNDFSSRTP